MFKLIINSIEYIKTPEGFFIMISIIIAIILGIISNKKKSRPKPDFSFEQKLSINEENQYCQYRINTSARNLPGWFFRLGVNNKSKTQITDANVRVEKIMKIDDRGNESLYNNNPFFLHWANENSDNSRTIYKNTPVFVDLLFTIKGEENAYIYYKNKHMGAGVNNRLFVGKYIVYIKLLSNDIDPLIQKIYVEVNGIFDGVKIELIS